MALLNKLAKGAAEEIGFWGDVTKGAFGMAFDMGKGVAKPAWSAARTIVPPTAKATNFIGKRLAEGAMMEASYVLKHPHMAIIEAGALYGAYKLSQTGPQSRSTTKEEDAQLAVDYDLPSTGFNLGEGSTRAALINSTDGLVQGLHRGRHHG